MKEGEREQVMKTHKKGNGSEQYIVMFSYRKLPEEKNYIKILKIYLKIYEF